MQLSKVTTLNIKTIILLFSMLSEKSFVLLRLLRARSVFKYPIEWLRELVKYINIESF